MWEFDHKKGWASKNWCFWTMVLEKILESSLDSKKFKPVNPKENQPWIHIWRTDAEAKAPILLPPEVKSWLTGKTLTGKDWKQEKGMTEDGIWSHHFMGNKWGYSVRLYSLGSKITADGDCSHEIKRLLLLGRKVMANLDSIFKSKDISLPTKVHLVKAMVLPVICMDVRIGL